MHRAMPVQAGPPPQVQPPALQPSAVPVQLTQAPPPAPHSPSEFPGEQVPSWAQQPEHAAAVHWQLPLTHSCPALQAGPAPHRQLPLRQAFAVIGLHALQLAPPLPQLVVVGDRHIPWLQHPLGQEAPSQTHVPPAQRCPAAQAGPLPQRHTPEAQESAVASHARQAAPPAPQVPTVLPGSQLPLLQQPVHDAASQTQVPLAQRWPTAQAAPAPHWHCPEAPQTLARFGSHEMQAAPPLPQADSDCRVTQVAPEQQPLQLSAVQPVHAPPMQVWFAGQEAHAAPPRPQAAAVFPERHALPSQHPPGHDAPSQMQTPAAQRWPVPHGAPAPHRQVPVGEQVSARLTSQLAHEAPGAAQVEGPRARQVMPSQQPLGQEVASQTQAPFMHRCPAPQGAPLPQAQAPAAEHRSDLPSQVLQTPPGAPQADRERASQAPERQHPVGQDWASQTQAPPAQRWPTGHTAPEPH